MRRIVYLRTSKNQIIMESNKNYKTIQTEALLQNITERFKKFFAEVDWVTKERERCTAHMGSTTMQHFLAGSGICQNIGRVVMALCVNASENAEHKGEYREAFLATGKDDIMTLLGDIVNICIEHREECMAELNTFKQKKKTKQ